MGEIIFFLTLRSPDRVSYQRIFFCSNKGLPLFSRICGILKAIPHNSSAALALPTNCAVLP